MTSLECARAAFAALCENSPANHCRLEGGVLDAGKAVPGGWSSARTLTEGLYGGKAIVNMSQQRLGEEQVPTAPPSPPTECAASGSGARAPIWRSSPGTGTPSACACTAWRTERPTARGDKCQTPESGCNSSCKAAVRMYLDVLYAVSQQRV